MLCPQCGTENATPFGYCTSCGKPLSTVESAIPPAPAHSAGAVAGAAPGTAPSPVVAEPKPMNRLALLAMFVVLALIVFLGSMLPTGEENQARALGFRIGRTFASLLLPFLIAYVFAGRKSARKPNQFALIFCGLAILLMGSYAVSSGVFGSSFESPDQHVGRLMREAAGLQPVRESLFPGRRRLDDALRDQFRALVRQNNDYTETVNKIDVSQVKYLNSPESFADPDSAAGALKQLHALCDADADQEAKVKVILDNLRHALETSASSPSERDTLLRGFDSGLDPQRAKRQAVVAAEKGWMDAVDDEYAYAAQNAGKLSLNQGHLVINDPEVRETFNTKIRFQESQRNAFLAAQKEFNEFQAQSLQKLGVNPKDIGAR
jgi:hypothetical protein